MRGYCPKIVICLCFLIAILSGIAPAQEKVPRQREVSLTFDDLILQGPVLSNKALRDMTAKLLRSAKANDVPLFGDVNEYKLYSNNKLDPERVAILKMWLDAGAELGNHTFTHRALGSHSLASVEEDVIRGETITRKLLQERGRKLRYFRHPVLRTGPDLATKKAFEKFLAGRGYTVAPVTIDNQDFIYAEIYARAKRRGDERLMKRVAEDYIPYMERMFEFFEKLSIDVVGYEVKQVLLLHANEINADYFNELVAMMRKRGYTFITLEKALQDKAYLLPDAQSSRGLSWIHRWALAKGMELRQEPREPEWLTNLFNERE